MILLKAMIEQAAQEIREEYPWPELQREYTFTLATSTDSYVLPGDFNSLLSETLWNRTQNQPLLGPIDAEEWQQYKSGLITSVPLERFRVKGWGTNQFYIDPTPGSTENGQTCAYEYISRTCIRPKKWVASTSWAGMQYCSYNGYIFDRGSTGAATTGTTAPTPTVPNDGSIAWTLYTSAFETINHDNDEIILNNQIVIDGAVWRFKRERGFDYEALMKLAEDQKEGKKTDLSGSGIVSLNRRTPRLPMIGVWNYPEGNF